MAPPWLMGELNQITEILSTAILLTTEKMFISRVSPHPWFARLGSARRFPPSRTVLEGRIGFRQPKLAGWRTTAPPSFWKALRGYYGTWATRRNHTRPLRHPENGTGGNRDGRNPRADRGLRKRITGRRLAPDTGHRGISGLNCFLPKGRDALSRSCL